MRNTSTPAALFPAYLVENMAAAREPSADGVALEASFALRDAGAVRRGPPAPGRGSSRVRRVARHVPDPAGRGRRLRGVRAPRSRQRAVCAGDRHYLELGPTAAHAWIEGFDEEGAS